MGRFDGKSSEHDGASPGKIFVGGLHRDTSLAAFTKHFETYGVIEDSVIMKDKNTHQPRGFGFITFVDPASVEKALLDTHVFHGKQVEIKRTIPKGASSQPASSQPKDVQTKKIFVGGIPMTVTDDELKDFFSNYGNVVEHQVMRDRATQRSRGFGFVIFDSEEAVDNLLSKGNMLDMAGAQVEIKKAEPKKSSNPSPSAFRSESRGHSRDTGLGGFGPYGGFGAGGYGAGPYRAPGLGGRFSDYGGYGSAAAGEFAGGYGLGAYRGESSLGYPSRFGSYSGGFGGGAYGVGSLGGYGPDGGLMGNGGSSYSGYGAGAGAGAGAGYGSVTGDAYGSVGPYGGGRGAGYGGGAGRFHPYGR